MIHEAHVEDKSEWPEGPWKEEPDVVQWTVLGYPCTLRRGPSGAWCGYVAVRPGHPAFGKDYDDVEVKVQGGLTYSGLGKVGAFEAFDGLYFLSPDNNAPVWGLGFDCAHYGDKVPGYERFWSLVPVEDAYRDKDYVMAEATRLAHQLRGQEHQVTGLRHWLLVVKGYWVAMTNKKGR